MSGPVSGVGLQAAFDELRLVHRKEQAKLLRAAGLLRCRAERRGRLYLAAAGRPRGPRRLDPCLADPRAWREACLEEIAAAEADDAEVSHVLRSLSAMSVRFWPRPHTLALASLALDRCLAGLVDLARVWITEGRPRAGIRILGDLLIEQPLAADRLQILEALALAFESTAETEEALDWYEATLDVPGCDPRVAVSMYSLALRCGDPVRTGIAAERLRSLDLSIPGTRTRFRVALAGAVERAGIRRPRPFRDEGRDEGMEERRARLLRAALEGRDAEAEIVRAMFSG